MKHQIPYFSTALLVPVLLLLAGCANEAPTTAASPEPPAGKVRTQRIELRSYPATEEAVGFVRAKTRAVLEANVAGRIEKMLVAEGQAVESGDLLVELDGREIAARLEQARARHDQVETDLKRLTGLMTHKAVTQHDYEAMETRLRLAAASLAEAEAVFGHASITAPFAGVITRKLADAGDLAAPGKPLLEIEDHSTLRFEAAVPESLLSQIQIGTKARVRLPAIHAEVKGIVSEIAPIADPDSHTVQVKLDLPETPGLRGGSFGRMLVPARESVELRAPRSALVQRGQLEILFVEENGNARLRLVKTGKRSEDEVEIVSGLKPGERVVVEGALTLRDGQRLEVPR